ALVVGHEILEIFQRNLFTFCGDELERRLWQGLYVDHRYALKISSVFPCRLQSVQRKLRPDVFRSNVSAALPGSPPLQQIARQEFHVRPDSLRIYRWRFPRFLRRLATAARQHAKRNAAKRK